MSDLLYRIGRGSIRHRRVVLAAWLIVLIGVLAAAAAFEQPTVNSFSIPGTESQRAGDLLEARFPERPDGASTSVVFAARGGATLTAPATKHAVIRTVERLEKVPQVVSVTDPYRMGGLSRDATIGIATVNYAVEAPEVDDTTKDALVGAVDPARDAGLRVEFGGAVHPGSSGGPGASSEVIGLLVAIVVLMITFGSLIAAGLPILTALIGVATGIGGITALSGVVEMSVTAPVLATMIGLAVGIDYALFIVSRHRQNLAAGAATEVAAANAVATAGSAVVFAALTVIVALVGLAAVGIPFVTIMALAAAGTVFIAALIAVTLLPALLGFTGTNIDRIPVPGLRPHRSDDAATGWGARWAARVIERPVVVIVAGVVAPGIIALPALSIELGLPSAASAPAESTQRKAYDLISAGFGPGFNGPLTIVADVADARAPKQAVGQAVGALRAIDGVAFVTPPTFNRANDAAFFLVFPETGPADIATADLVHEIRGDAASVAATDGAHLAVTGPTAVNIDVSAKLAEALPVFAVIVVGLALLILLVAFRSVLIPIKAAVGFLLTMAASFGAVVAVFQWGWLATVFGVQTTGPVISFLPILLMAVLFGLAMDYELFLVSRMREEVDGGAEPRAAILAGFAGGARVVTAAALIMTSVFAAFVLTDDAIIKSMGFALAIGVLIDAFVVRMTLVPAALALLGRSAWWIPR